METIYNIYKVSVTCYEPYYESKLKHRPVASLPLAHGPTGPQFIVYFYFIVI